MEVDLKRQRIALTMRLRDMPGDTLRSKQARPETNTAPSQQDKRPAPTSRQEQRQAQPTGLLAIALEKAKQKK
jgi:uncharacterized protein